MSVLPRLALADDCRSCQLRQQGDFCSLPQDALAWLESQGHLSVFPPYVTLLAEGEFARGVFVLCSGRAKLSVVAKDGKTVILRIAEERQILGLSAVVSGRPSLITATSIEPCQVKFVGRENFLALLERDSRAAMGCAIALSREVGQAFQGVHSLLLARSSTEKLARLLLSWVADEPRNQELRVHADFTHEEMAQMIGSSRETVTRLLNEMRRKELIRLDGSTLIIPNRIALQAIAA